MGYQRQKFNQIAVSRLRRYDSSIEKRDMERLNVKRLRRYPGSNYRDRMDFREDLGKAAERRKNAGPEAHNDTEGSDIG